MATKPGPLPPLAPFPEAAWRSNIVPQEWEACLDAWISIADAHLSFSPSDFKRFSLKDESLSAFLASYITETATTNENTPSVEGSKSHLLRKQTFLLSYKLLDATPPSEHLLRWQFLADLCKVYGRKQGAKIITMVFKKHSDALESSLNTLKISLIKELEGGLKGNLKKAEAHLKKVNQLLHASPDASAFFLAGSDFLDSLISCYKIMNPPLRKVIISTTYLCLIGLTEDEKPRISSLIDQLYSLEAAAVQHKNGPTNVNDSLVAELVTVTPILKLARERIAASGSGSGRAASVLTNLEGFKKAGGLKRPVRKVKRREKGKGVDVGWEDGFGSSNEIHIHRMSLVSQVQDLFPDLGSGFVVKLLDEYGDNTEEVISHLLDGSLPPHLEKADRTEELKPPTQTSRDFVPNLAPHSTPPEYVSDLPERCNIFDNDAFDNLTIQTSKLHIGRRNPNQTADDVLDDKSTAPNKAAILSALAAFDFDDDERDDTYDTADVGGTVDYATPGNTNEPSLSHELRDAQDEILFKAFKSNPKVFGRDPPTRRSPARAVLKSETGMTDESLEGWALMLSRDNRQMRRLEAKFSHFGGEQRELKASSWRATATPGGSGTEDSDVNERGGNPNDRGRGGRLRGAPRGDVAGTNGESTEAARRGKEASKGSRANHNRRDQRAKKMARGGFAG
ncbi:hypothetical protein HYALB_00001312 [Hymenoscyphus albidus]|uniref:CUE domain-containing protein n=1 Tax=Hymenoscyphus albidus TaxID=595503 RepID=A0A9N9LHX5_9HELO|nr:hypothetical protein HYALB_00001312 [Hymenoscyphus albidus]